LGGGHSKHHFHTTHPIADADTAPTSSQSVNGKKKRVKILRILRSSSKGCISNDEASNDSDVVSNEVMGGHEVCIDIVSKAVHCYACDDYVLSDAPWLASLRLELNDIEMKRDEISVESDKKDDSVDGNYEMVEAMDDAVHSAAIDAESSPEKSPGKAGETKFQPGITGLTNLGNTCYMNSVLQMLSHCSGFRSFFRDFLRAAAPLSLAGEGRYQITRQSTTRLQKELLVDSSPKHLALTEATHALLRVLWSGRWPYITPRYFVNAVWKHGGLFAARKQQDANEFLNFFLGRVDDELKAPRATQSVMMDLFGVDQYQEVTCDECNTVTKRTEPLLGLMLSLPDENKHDNGGDGIKRNEDEAHSPSTSDDICLIDCFKSLQTTGRFVEDNQFDCETCKGKKDASWSVSLQRRPQSLLISLRRTLWDAERGIHKDSRRVKFPIELDCTDLLDLEKNRNSPDEDFEGCHYGLKAVVAHSGSSPFVGHYISWCLVGEKWFLFNDSSVTEATQESVLDAEAFILLYERREIPSIENVDFC
jgi:ubiquitin C-terminal hydrolase